MKLVVDEGVPRQLVAALRQAGLDAHRFRRDWRETSNGALIAAIEADGYALLLTNDKNIADQQSLKGRAVAVVALPLNRRAAIMVRIDDIVDTIRRAKPGQHVVMGLDGSRRVRIMVDGRTIEDRLPDLPSFKTR